VSNISALFPQSTSLIHKIQENLNRLESGPTDGRQVGDICKEASDNIQELKRNVLYLDKLANEEAPNRKEMWIQRVKQLSDESVYLESTFNRLYKFTETLREKETRRGLFDDASSRHGPAINGYIEEHSSLQRSTNIIDQLITQAHHSMDSLGRQRALLKNAQKHVLTVMNTLGLSNSVIKLSERRETLNKWMVWGCMLLTLFIMFMTYWFFRRS